MFLDHIACIAQMRPIATNVARSVVCASVCWSQRYAVHKQLYRSRCSLGPTQIWQNKIYWHTLLRNSSGSLFGSTCMLSFLSSSSSMPLRFHRLTGGSCVSFCFLVTWMCVLWVYGTDGYLGKSFTKHAVGDDRCFWITRRRTARATTTSHHIASHQTHFQSTAYLDDP